MYKIKKYTLQKARELNVHITSSNNPKYKITVYDKYYNYLCDVGASGYMDYPSYIEDYGLEYANSRRKLYKKRHNKDLKIKGSRGYYADQLLW